MTVSVAIGLALAVIAAAATSLGWLMKSRGAQASAPTRHDRPAHRPPAPANNRSAAHGQAIA
jgi:hypothetical protein